MKENLRSTLWRVAAFLVVCVVGIFAIIAVFGQLRFQDENAYSATFSNVSGLREGDFVRIAGVEVGQVKSVKVQPDATVNVDFTADSSVALTEGNLAIVRYQNLTGDRYLAIDEGAGGVRRLQPGQTIPLERTQPALDIDTLIGGFKPLFRSLQPEQVNAVTGQLIQAFQGQGTVVSAFLAQTAALTSTLADRDELIGQVIDNLNTVLSSLGEKSKQLDVAVDSVEKLVTGLADRRDDVTNSIAYTNAAAGSIADLLHEARPPLKNTVQQLERVSSLVMADNAYFDNILNTLPDKYQTLSRLGLYGDFFNFYLCDAVLKVNGKGGQPVYVKLVGQDTGRCAPK